MYKYYKICILCVWIIYFKMIAIKNNTKDSNSQRKPRGRKEVEDNWALKKSEGIKEGQESCCRRVASKVEKVHL